MNSAASPLLGPIVSVIQFLERADAARATAATHETAGPRPELIEGVPGTGALIVADVRWSLAKGSLREEYLAGHIPGAIFVDLEADLVGEGAPEAGRHPFPSDDDFAETLGRLGIAFEDTVVCYSAGDPMPAARFALMLRLVGVNAAVLDGGLDAYARAVPNAQLESGDNPPEPTDFGWQPFAQTVSIDEVAHATHTKGALVIDARARERFRGDVEPIDPRAGHIPSALNLPYTELLEADATFLTPERLRKKFQELGITASRLVMNYCGSGISACVNMLALEHAGYEHLFLYPGSFSEWSRDETRAVETGE